MPDTLARQIEREVASWNGVVVKPHRFGGIEFIVGRREIGQTREMKRERVQRSPRNRIV